MGMDIITGRNYIGDPTRDGLLSATKELLAPTLMPIWVQSVLLEGGAGVTGRLTRGAGEFMGLRTYPESAWQSFEDFAEEMTGKDYDELSNLEKDKVKDTDEGARLWQEYIEEQEHRGRAESGTGKMFADFRQIDQTAYDKEEALVREIQAGPKAGETPSDFMRRKMDAYAEIQSVRSAQREQAMTSAGVKEEGGPPEDPIDRAIWQYYKAFDLARLGSGEFDWDRYDKFRAMAESTWTDEQKQAVADEESREGNHPEFIQTFLKAREKLRPYWETDERMRDAYRVNNLSLIHI